MKVGGNCVGESVGSVGLGVDGVAVSSFMSGGVSVGSTMSYIREYNANEKESVSVSISVIPSTTLSASSEPLDIIWH